MSTDVVVIGGGHNGLTAATYLARSGAGVLLIEQQSQLGGLCAPREFSAGFTVPGLLHDTACFRDWIVKDLGLSEFGLERQKPSVIAVPDSGESILLLDPSDPAQAVPDLADWRKEIAAVRTVIRDLVDQPPLSLEPSGVGSYLELLRQGFGIFRLGDRDFHTLARILPTSLEDWLLRHTSDGPVAEALAADALFGSFTGPKAAGTAANLLIRECCAGEPISGGPAGLIAALETAAKAAGVQIRTGMAVQQIEVSGGRVTGVRLEDGELLESRAVLATCDPKTTFMRLVDPAQNTLSFETRVNNIRSRGTAGKIHLAVKGAFNPNGSPEPLEHIRYAGGGFNAIERAFDALKYNQISESPYLDIWIPSASNPSLAPEGHHVVSILAYGAPFELTGGWDDSARERLTEIVLSKLNEIAPAIQDQVVAMETLGPADIAAAYGVTGGQLGHVEYALDQFHVMRPAPECARYATPIAGLFVGGSGSHPSGGVTGVPGALSAKQLEQAL
ncbi:MAG: NAD(P)/FAD-dependent oxidoreductase [Acidobacteriota bacterium]|nr:MAG: NAD(P)/FAD-dependent oxidoreductase [Acidobacteriota bacterium]